MLPVELDPLLVMLRDQDGEREGWLQHPVRCLTKAGLP